MRPRLKTNGRAPPPSSSLCVTAAAAHVNRTRSLLSFLPSICVWTPSSPAYEEIRRCLSGEKKYCARRLCDLEPVAPGKSGKLTCFLFFAVIGFPFCTYIHSIGVRRRIGKPFFAFFHWELPSLEGWRHFFFTLFGLEM